MNKPTHESMIKGLFGSFVISMFGLTGTALAQDLEPSNNDQVDPPCLTMPAGDLVINGALDTSAGDWVDIYKINANPNDDPTILVESGDACAAMDPTVALFDEMGNRLRFDMDQGLNGVFAGLNACDAKIAPGTSLTGGTYYVVVTAATGSVDRLARS